jgi:MerR family mercuric resistance operon transcriptional regulator
MDRMLTIGELAGIARVTVDTVRYYERMRLLPKPVRTPAGYRLYPPQIVRRLNVVRSAQRFGFTLKQIAAFLGARDSGGKPCHAVRAGAQRILDAVDAQIAELLTARRQLRSTLRDWDDLLARTPEAERAFLLERLSNAGTPHLSCGSLPVSAATRCLATLSAPPGQRRGLAAASRQATGSACVGTNSRRSSGR